MNQPNEVETMDHWAIFRRHDPHNRLGLYYRWLTKENERINLVSRETIREGFERLVFESLVPLEKIDPARVHDYLDIGSGGGLPAMPIILSLTSQGRSCNATLVERIQKKCGALRRISLRLELDRTNTRLDLICEPFEQCRFHREFDLITLRYVALTEALLQKILTVLRSDGAFIYFSTPAFEIDDTQCEAVTHYYRSDLSPQKNSFTIFRKK
ncbi:MAG: class I SAM-dependent methyltransferase [candidate division Zixibacteria bacterium]|nr:class I SAM-dependent methyltransferase [candidate division Zixibacteria bacterium]